jgi:hypothetical protein
MENVMHFISKDLFEENQYEEDQSYEAAQQDLMQEVIYINGKRAF